MTRKETNVFSVAWLGAFVAIVVIGVYWVYSILVGFVDGREKLFELSGQMSRLRSALEDYQEGKGRLPESIDELRRSGIIEYPWRDDVLNDFGIIYPSKNPEFVAFTLVPVMVPWFDGGSTIYVVTTNDMEVRSTRRRPNQQEDVAR